MNIGSMPAKIKSFCRRLLRREQIDLDLDDEIRSQLGLMIDDKISKGLPADEARRTAMIELGGVEQVKEEVRAVSTGAWLNSLLQDIRFGLRMLRKSPGFTTVAVLTLGLGIGANTAIFSVIDALLLRDLPVQQPESLVQISQVQANGRTSPLTFPMFEYIEQHQQAFSGVFGWFGDGIFPVQIGDSVSFDDVWAVTGNIYSELGVSPQLGRLITPSDADPSNGAPPEVAVIGYGFWQRRFGGKAEAVGRQIMVNGFPFTIIGVTRKGFSGMSAVTAPDVTVPITAISALTSGRLDLKENKSVWLAVGGRLKNGLSAEQAAAQIRIFWPRLRDATLPEGYSGQIRDEFLKTRVEVSSAATGTAMSLRGSFSHELYLLMGMVSLLLLAVCLNLANLLLARASARSHELSVRASMGASRWRLIRQLSTESLLLSGFGALAGFGIALYCGRLLVNFMTQYYLVPAALDMKPDMRVFGVTASVAMFAGMVCAIAPAWMAAQQDPARMLQESGRGFSRKTGTTGKALVVIQVALSVVLLLSAGLIVRSLESLRSANPGFKKDGLMDVVLYPRPEGYKSVDAESYYRELVESVSSIQGVRGASRAQVIPGRKDGLKARVSSTEGEQSHKAFSVDEGFISPGFFNAVGVRVVVGRDFEWDDNERGARVGILNDNLAKEMFPSGNALGQFIRIGDDPNYSGVRVVGVVNDGRLLDVRDPQGPAIYLSMLQNPLFEKGGGDIIIREAGDSQQTIDEVREKIAALGREYVFSARTVEDISEQTLLPERAMAILSSCFGVAALLLCAIGLYGLMSYSIAGRTREFGIRIALGAQRAEVLTSVLRESALLTVAGIAIGVPCALAATRVIRVLIYGISTGDILTITAVVGTLFAVGILASYVPARRAMRVDPMVALRHE